MLFLAQLFTFFFFSTFFSTIYLNASTRTATVWKMAPLSDVIVTDGNATQCPNGYEEINGGAESGMVNISSKDANCWCPEGNERLGFSGTASSSLLRQHSVCPVVSTNTE